MSTFGRANDTLPVFKNPTKRINNTRVYYSPGSGLFAAIWIGHGFYVRVFRAVNTVIKVYWYDVPLQFFAPDQEATSAAL